MSSTVPQHVSLAMCLRYKDYDEDGLYCADEAEEYKETGVTNKLNDRTRRLDCDEDHQELKGDDGTAHKGLQVG